MNLMYLWCFIPIPVLAMDSICYPESLSGVGLVLPQGPIPEHPIPASQPGQDSYVSKGGPLGGLWVLLAVIPVLNT